MPTLEVKVPDIGDFSDVPVIDVLVKPGDAVKPEDPLVTLESDKATMDVPSPAEGTVKAIAVKVGDKVSQGSALLTVETNASAAPSPQPSPASGKGSESSKSSPLPRAGEGPGVRAEVPRAGDGSGVRGAPAAPTFTGRADLECEMLVLGSGPGGYSAAFRSADLGMKTVLVERYPTLAGVCLNVGCIPSKALLRTAALMNEVRHLPAHGLRVGAPELDLAKMRAFKEGVIRKLTGGLAGMAKARKVEVATGVGRFLDPHHVEVTAADG